MLLSPPKIQLSAISFCSVWQSVQKSVDFTVPLYKWNKSYMQHRYYGSLNIDPMVRGASYTLWLLLA